MKTAVIAIGGNAILLAGERGTKEEQIDNLKITCKHLAELIREGYDLVLTHGNGPQVGNIMLQNEVGEDSSSSANGSATNGAEESRELSLFAGFKFLDFRAEKEVFGQPPRMSLDVCGAESQGEIGYLLQQALVNELEVLGIKKTVVSVITQVLVDKDDEAFHNPTKPIGPYYGEKEATRIMIERGWKMVQDKARGGWRRVVPSPMPKEIVERDAIMRLIFSGKDSSIIVIAAGGGGIPVIRKCKMQNAKCKIEDGSRQGGISTPLRYEGVEAVIDKDLAASVLARSIKEKLFIMLTDVKKVALDFGTEKQKDLGEMSLKEAKRYLADGQFPSGSMGPKIEAAILFLEGGGEEVIITSPDNLLRAIKGEEGTHVKV